MLCQADDNVSRNAYTNNMIRKAIWCLTAVHIALYKIFASIEAKNTLRLRCRYGKATYSASSEVRLNSELWALRRISSTRVEWFYYRILDTRDQPPETSSHISGLVCCLCSNYEALSTSSSVSKDVSWGAGCFSLI